MAIYVWKNPSIWMGQYDIGGYLNTVSIDYGNELLDASAMGAATIRQRVAGYRTLTCEVGGYWDGVPDAVFFNQMGLKDMVLTIAPDPANVIPAVAILCYFYKPAVASYTPGAAVGEVLPFRMTADSSEPLKRGIIAAPKLLRSSGAGTGTGYFLGLLGSGQTLYSVVHVFATEGTGETLDVVIQSDTAVDFPSPTARIVHTQFTAIGHEQKTLAGPVADDSWWRATWTIGGADTPKFNFAVVLGIL